jgi:hypothetical protein
MRPSVMSKPGGTADDRLISNTRLSFRRRLVIKKMGEECQLLYNMAIYKGSLRTLPILTLLSRCRATMMAASKIIERCRFHIHSQISNIRPLTMGIVLMSVNMKEAIQIALNANSTKSLIQKPRDIEGEQK